MSPFDLLLAAGVLVATVCTGTVVHEFAHAAVLRAAGVPFEFRWLQGAGADRLAGGLVGTWASVRMQSVPADLPARHLRFAAMAPLVLAVPLLAIPAGLVPDPFAAGTPLLQAAVIGWLACTLPSPADFSLLWHAENVVDGRA